MSMLTFFAIAAMMGAVFALACGIAAMVSNEAVLRLRSEQWMGWRVAWQAVAVLLAALLLATAAYGETPAPAGCVYDYTMLTARECRVYRDQVLKAASDEERLSLLRSVNERMEARARERGTRPDDWRGLAAIPPAAPRGALSGPEIATSLALLAAIAAVAYIVLQTVRPGRNVRLMRCPETAGIAFVEAENAPYGQWTAPRVRHCDLWPARKDCARGCLARYAETAPGFLVNVNALRPFEHR
jgi:hypothetical protein